MSYAPFAHTQRSNYIDPDTKTCNHCQLQSLSQSSTDDLLRRGGKTPPVRIYLLMHYSNVSKAFPQLTLANLPTLFQTDTSSPRGTKLVDTFFDECHFLGSWSRRSTAFAKLRTKSISRLTLIQDLTWLVSFTCIAWIIFAVISTLRWLKTAVMVFTAGVNRIWVSDQSQSNKMINSTSNLPYPFTLAPARTSLDIYYEWSSCHFASQITHATERRPPER